jgi:3,4-dihydroxy 2-butanone 4-phosphate synthase/GTP cyclohydrolase II
MNNNYIHEAGTKTVPIYGTTIYIGEVPLETVYGKFIAKTYQDTIHKGYIVSLVFGDLKGNHPLYIRMHSSCITSECLRSTDCDCV